MSSILLLPAVASVEPAGRRAESLRLQDSPGAAWNADSAIPTPNLVARVESTKITRHTAVGEGASSEAAAGVPILVYSNTLGTILVQPGGGRLIADDIRIVAACGCTLDRYELLVSGGGDGTGPGFTVDYAIYDDCPSAGGQMIPGTSGTTVVPDDGDHLITLSAAGAGVEMPRVSWIGVQFDTSGGGWMGGAPADIGITYDLFDWPFFSCGATFGVGYAGFYAEIYCDQSNNAPPVPINPTPTDGATEIPPDTMLSWANAGRGASVPPPGGDGMTQPDIGEFTVDDLAWMDNLTPGEWCGTQHRFEAKGLGGGDDGARGGCPDDGLCDDPAARDGNIPDANTPLKIFRALVHVFCFDSGAGCTATQASVDATIATLNADYAPWRIEFEHTTLFHNDTTNRNLSAGESALKNTYAQLPDQQLNIYVVVTGGSSWGTFPWDPDALQNMGGIVMGDSQFGGGNHTISHEVGHNVGLWHTHHGVSEVSQCGVCYEMAGSFDDNAGDRCSDTDPTPTNFSCGPPGGTDPCNSVPWGTTDFRNYMGYASSTSCVNFFSAQQAGRFHCWTDDVLSGWLLAQCGSTYDVLLGKVNPPTQLVCEGISQTTCDPGPLECNTLYYWQVIATSVDNGSVTEGALWTFTTESGPDCNGNLIADACDILSGFSADCNANGIPDDCEPDCQPNGVADECDISGGGSQDCDGNGVPDECQADADGDGVPDVCDICAGGDDTVDADGDGVPDFCDICPGGNDNLDSDGDGVPNFCDICPGGNDALDADADGVPDFCDACPGEDDTLDADGDTVPDGCDVCPGGDDTVDTDGDTVPDDCDICPGGNDLVDTDGDAVPDDCDNCALANPDQADCQPNGVGDVCDIDTGTSADGNGNGVPDECEIAAPIAEDGLGVACDPGVCADASGPCERDADCPAGIACNTVCLGESYCMPDAAGGFPGTCYVPKNRYVSIAPNASNADTGRRVSVDTLGGPVVLGWVGMPDAFGVSRVVPEVDRAVQDWSTLSFPIWCSADVHCPNSDCGNTVAGQCDTGTTSAVHLGDCHISPGHEYLIQAIPAGAPTADEGSYAAPLTLRTCDAWGDVMGATAGGIALPPDGGATFGDILGVVLGFQSSGAAPPSWMDLVPEDEPDYDVAFADILAAVQGFQNSPFAGDDPCTCAGLAACP